MAYVAKMFSKLSLPGTPPPPRARDFGAWYYNLHVEVYSNVSWRSMKIWYSWPKSVRGACRGGRPRAPWMLLRSRQTGKTRTHIEKSHRVREEIDYLSRTK